VRWFYFRLVRVVFLRHNYILHRRATLYAIQAARKAGINVPDFYPHQLRHTAATRIRKEFGLDAARAALGQRNIQMTDEYAELDKGLAARAAMKCG
jgi:integrase